MDKPEQIKAWQKRLEDTFSYNEIVGGRYLLHTMDTEKAVGNHFIKKYHGHRILTDSFLDFCGETIDTQVAFNNQHGWPQGQPYYATCLLMYVTMFRTVRSAELLSANGYPLQGYAVFRGLKDQVFVLCVLQMGSPRSVNSSDMKACPPQRGLRKTR